MIQCSRHPSALLAQARAPTARPGFDHDFPRAAPIRFVRPEAPHAPSENLSPESRATAGQAARCDACRAGAAFYAGSKTFSSVPIPSMMTSTVVFGFIGKTPNDVPQAIISPGFSVMSCEIALTSRGTPMIMSETG